MNSKTRKRRAPGARNLKLEKIRQTPAGLPPTPKAASAAMVMASIELDAKPLIEKLSGYVVKTQENFDLVAQTVKVLELLGDRAELEEKTITDPLNIALKATRAHFKPFKDLVASLKLAAKSTMLLFLASQQKKKEALNAKLEDGTIKKISTLVRKQAELEVSSGAAQIRKVWALIIVDVKKIPREYMIPDETAIRSTLRDGGTVAGCEWKQQDSIAI